MSGANSDATSDRDDASSVLSLGVEVWMVEATKDSGKANQEALAVAIQEAKGKEVLIKIVNVTTEVPCGLGMSMPQSQVERKTIKAHEIHTFKTLITPLLTYAGTKKVKLKYLPARNDKRDDGLVWAAEKLKPARIYLPIKKSSDIVSRLSLVMPGGSRLVGVCGGKKIAEEDVHRVEMYDSTKEEAGAGIDFFDDRASEYSSGTPMDPSTFLTSRSMPGSMRHSHPAPVTRSDSFDEACTFGSPFGHPSAPPSASGRVSGTFPVPENEPSPAFEDGSARSMSPSYDLPPRAKASPQKPHGGSQSGGYPLDHKAGERKSVELPYSPLSTLIGASVSSSNGSSFSSSSNSSSSLLPSPNSVVPTVSGFTPDARSPMPSANQAPAPKASSDKFRLRFKGLTSRVLSKTHSGKSLSAGSIPISK